MAPVAPSEVPAPAAPVSADRLSYFRLYRYATLKDGLLTLLGLLGAIASGLTMPMFTIVFGEIVTALGEAQPGAEVTDRTDQIALKFIYVALGGAVASYLGNAMFMLSGARGHSTSVCLVLQARAARGVLSTGRPCRLGAQAALHIRQRDRQTCRLPYTSLQGVAQAYSGHSADGRMVSMWHRARVPRMHSAAASTCQNDTRAASRPQARTRFEAAQVYASSACPPCLPAAHLDPTSASCLPAHPEADAGVRTASHRWPLHRAQQSSVPIALCNRTVSDTVNEYSRPNCQ